MKQMVKTLISAGVICASTVLATSTAFAAHKYKDDFKGEAAPAPCPIVKVLNDGFYVGANVGYDSWRARNSLNIANAGGESINASTVGGAAGWVGNLLVGYGRYLNETFYLGGEIFGGASGAESTNSGTVTADGQTASFYSKFSVGALYGLTVRPGIKLNDSTLGYLRLGWDWARLTGKGSVTGDGVTSSGSNTKWQNGFALGVGMETAVYENWSLRGDFTHVFYNSFSSNGAKFSPSNNQYTLGVSYTWA